MEDPEATTHQPKAFTREYLVELSTLSVEVLTDLSEVVHRLNERLGTALQPREGGQHITVIGPTENHVLKDLTDEQFEDLKNVSLSLKNGDGIEVNGIGYIDGRSQPNLREVDTQKRVSYVALSIPALQEFRASVGLPEKDFHITLGFETGDIHAEITGQTETGKNILRPISKKADKNLSDIELPELEFSRLAGKEKQKPKNN